jgi:hypothetical protein
VKLKIAKVVAAAVLVAGVACIDLTAPKNQPASISLTQVPEFFVVRGDVMRDTLGNPVSPGVVAFDGAGTPVGSFTPSFFITDSLPLISFNSDGVVAAGNVLGQAHIIGQIGTLQTPATTIFVTVAPTKLVNTTVGDSLHLVFGPDSSSSIAAFSLSAALRGIGDTAVAGGIVQFVILTPVLASNTTAPAMYLDDGAGNRTSIDTSGFSGDVSRRLVINSRALADTALSLGHKVDTVIVEARMKYRGVQLTGAPAPRFLVRVVGGFGG